MPDYFPAFLDLRELASLADDLGFTPSDLARFQANAFAIAAMDASARIAILSEIDAVMAQA